MSLLEIMHFNQRANMHFRRVCGGRQKLDQLFFIAQTSLTMIVGNALCIVLVTLHAMPLEKQIDERNLMKKLSHFRQQFHI